MDSSGRPLNHRPTTLPRVQDPDSPGLLPIDEVTWSAPLSSGNGHLAHVDSDSGSGGEESDEHGTPPRASRPADVALASGSSMFNLHAATEGVEARAEDQAMPAERDSPQIGDERFTTPPRPVTTKEHICWAPVRQPKPPRRRRRSVAEVRVNLFSAFNSVALDASPLTIESPRARQEAYDGQNVDGIMASDMDFDATAEPVTSSMDFDHVQLVPTANAKMEPSIFKAERPGDDQRSVASTATLPRRPIPHKEFASPGDRSVLSQAHCGEERGGEEFYADIRSKIVMKPVEVGAGSAAVRVPSELRARVMCVETAAASSPRAQAMQRASNQRLGRLMASQHDGDAYAHLPFVRGQPFASSRAGSHDVVAYPSLIEALESSAKDTEGQSSSREPSPVPTFVTPSKRKRSASVTFADDPPAAQETFSSVVNKVMISFNIPAVEESAGIVLPQAADTGMWHGLLPPQLAVLLKVFEALDNAVLLNRKRRSGSRGNASAGSSLGVLATFDVLKPIVESYCGHSFEMNHLLQLAAVAPLAYKLTAEMVNEKNQAAGHDALPSSAIVAALANNNRRDPGILRVVIDLDPRFAVAGTAHHQAAVESLPPKASPPRNTSPKTAVGSVGSSRAAMLMAAASKAAGTAAKLPSSLEVVSGGIISTEAALVAAQQAKEAKQRQVAVSESFHASHAETSLIARRRFFLAHLLALLHQAHAEHAHMSIDESIAYVKSKSGWSRSFDAASVVVSPIPLATISDLFAARPAGARVPEPVAAPLTAADVRSREARAEGSVGAASIPVSETDRVREERRAALAKAKANPGALPSSAASGDPDLAGIPAFLLERARANQAKHQVLLSKQRATAAGEVGLGVAPGLRTAMMSSVPSATKFVECLAAQFLFGNRQGMLVKELVPKVGKALGVSINDADVRACVDDLQTLCPSWLSLQELDLGTNCRLRREIPIREVCSMIAAELKARKSGS
jgi:hypothetical protein